MDRLAEVEASLGPVAVMSLERRGLLAPIEVPQHGGAPVADRVAGALVGVAVDRSRTTAAEQTALVSAEAWADRSWQSAARVSDRLAATVQQLRDPGRAIVAAATARRSGAVWFEAAGPSYGNAALPRAIAVGATLADDPTRAALAAQLDTATTHAHPIATGCAAVVAALVGALVTRIDDISPGDSVERTLHDLERIGGPVGRLAAQALSTARSAHTPGELPGGSTAPSAMTIGVRALLQPDPRRALAGLAADPGVGRTAVAVAGGLVGAALGASHCGPASPEATTGTASIWFLLDRSGSMASIADDVVGGFDTFIADQRAQAGDATITVVQFDGQDPHEVLVDAAPLGRVRSIAQGFMPRGNTPLFDAVALLLDRAERARGDDADQLVVIFTDGEENASRVWTREALFDRIGRLHDRGWTFVFLGANQDAYAAGQVIGLGAGSVSNFAADSAGVGAAYRGLSRATREWRGKSRQARGLDAQRFWGDAKEAEDDLRNRTPHRGNGAR